MCCWWTKVGAALCPACISCIGTVSGLWCGRYRLRLSWNTSPLRLSTSRRRKNEMEEFMCWKRFKLVGLNVFILWLTAEDAFGQGFLVDQASGTISEPVTTSSILPTSQVAQSFTPSLSAVGFV